MRIGVDFDNTIVCYDRLFYQIALEQQLIPAHVPAVKEEVRNHLRRAGREKVWTELQGYVYGERIREADIFPGVLEFFSQAKALGIWTCIISHKTRHPFEGPQYDLHQAARNWIQAVGLLEERKTGLLAESVYFEPTKQRKLTRIGEAGCTFFIDDLPEFLSEAAFPAHIKKVLFDPARSHAGISGMRTAASWSEIIDLVLNEKVSVA